MSARVLIVDDFAPNLKLLEARLTAEYFDVVTASSGPEALAVCGQGDCDIVLLDVMMPGMDGLEVCRRLKRDPATHHLPVVMVTALDQPADRVRGLEAGADDFLTKPIDEVALVARVRSLTRLKVVLDELRSRAAASANLGMPDAVPMAMREDIVGASILLIEDRASAAATIKGAFEPLQHVDVESNPQEALFKGVEGHYDLFVISLGLQGHDGLRLCSQFRSLERTRHVPILIVAEPEDRPRVLRGLDLGVNDYLLRPIDRNELMARARTQLRRKRYADRLRENLQASIEMAVVDTLTGLSNRRFFDSNFPALIEQSARKGRPLSLMILDIDHFKRVNDTLRARCRRPDPEELRRQNAPGRALERHDLSARRRGVRDRDAGDDPRDRRARRRTRAAHCRKRHVHLRAGSAAHYRDLVDRPGGAWLGHGRRRADAARRPRALPLQGRRSQSRHRRRRLKSAGVNHVC